MRRHWRRWLAAFIAGAGLAFLGLHMFSYVVHVTGTNEFCGRCHELTPFVEQWRLSSHFSNSAGVVADCVDCHLPPEGMAFLTAKAWLGLVDVYGHFFKDTSRIDWEEKLKEKGKFLWDEACLTCHQNLTPPDMGRGGFLAHREYQRGRTSRSCADCHDNLVHTAGLVLFAGRGE